MSPGRLEALAPLGTDWRKPTTLDEVLVEIPRPRLRDLLRG